MMKTCMGGGVVLAAACGILGSLSDAMAQAVPVSVVRSMDGTTRARALFCAWDEDSGTVQGAGYGSWNGLLHLESQFCENPKQVMQLDGVQDSLIEPGRIFVTSRTQFTQPQMASMGRSAARCESRFQYTFTLAQDTPYVASIRRVITGNVGNYLSSISLQGPNGQVFYHGNFVQTPTLSGVLPAGQYEAYMVLFFDFENFTNLSAQQGALEGEFDLVLSGGSCPCDWNSDQVVNSQDFFGFLESFFAGTGDYNNSGAVDSQDLFDFLGCFFDGCL